MFDSPTKHATAEEKRVERPDIGVPFDDDETNQSVIAKAIPHADRPEIVPAAGDERLHVGFVATDGGEVELIGPQRQLGGTAKILWSHRRDVDDQLQAGDE